MKIKILVLALLTLITLPIAGLADPFYYPYYFSFGTITGYAGPAGYVNIPTTINNMTVTSIGNSAFFDCTQISSVTIPNTVTNIGEGAFYGCTSMNGVTIGSGVASIGEEPFEDCTSLFLITVDAANTNYSAVANVLFNKSQTTLVEYPGGISGSYTIPNSVTNIGSQAFGYCLRLTGVTIPGSVASIGDYAFESTGLTSVTIFNGVANIGQAAFGFCHGLTSVVLPTSVTSIGNFAFDGCTNLTSVTVPNGVTSIGAQAFAYCPLTSVVIPTSVTVIGQTAFFNCGLTNVTIPNTVISIGYEAFENCPNLTSVTIPQSATSVTSLGGYAFSGCTNLTGIYFKGNAPIPDPFNDPTVFSGDIKATVYYLPGTTGWGQVFDGLPTKLWNPQVQTKSATFGVRTNQFGFTITGTSNLVIVVETCTSLANPAWTPVGTNTLNTFIGTNGTSYFSDQHWANYPGRFYRLRSP